MICSKCKTKITCAQPISTCNIVTKTSYSWITRTLCEQCTKDLFIFLDGSDTRVIETPEQNPWDSYE